MRIAGIDDRLGDVDKAAQAYYECSRSTRETQRRSRRSSSSSRAPQRWKDLIGVVERRIEQTSDPREREALYGHDGADLRREARPSRGRRRGVQEGSRARPGERSRAHGALDDLFTRQKMWRELAENLEAQLALADGGRRAARAHAPARRRCASARWDSWTSPSKDTGRCSNALRRTRKH